MKTTRTLAFALNLVLGGASLFAADPRLLNLAIPNAQMYAGINIAQAKTSQFGQFLLTQLPETADFQQFVTLTGFDPRRDLGEILVSTTGVASAGTPGAPAFAGLLAAKGTFNLQQILAAAATDAKVTTPIYSGVQLIVIDDGDHNPALAILDANTALAGEIAVVKAAIDRSGGSNVIDPAIQTRIDQLSNSEDAWSVSSGGFPSMLPIPGAGNSGSAVLQGITQASAGVKFGSTTSNNVQVEAQAIAKDAADATSLSDVVKLVSQMIAMHGANGAASPLSSLLQSLAVSTDGNIVNVSLSLPADQLESLIKQAGEHHNALRHVDKI